MGMFRRAPGLHRIDWVIEEARTSLRHVEGNCVPARPEGYYSLWNRLKLAWGVFTGKFDALQWPNQ